MNIDYQAELSEFEWDKPKWSDDKLIACSPFRDDRTPSFYVSLEHGGFLDAGAYDEDWRSGDFTKLLAWLRRESVEETSEFLEYKYGTAPADDALTLQVPRLKTRKLPQRADASLLDVLTPGSPYLERRGISAAVIAEHGVRSSAHYTAIPWRLPDGRLANIKYRSHYDKTFWYAKSAWPVRDLVYGIDVVNKRRARRAVLCEAEVDALSWSSVGVPGIAVGGVSFSKAQVDIIRRSSIEVLVLGGDNDKAGRKLNAEVRRALAGVVRIEEADYGAFKDANEALQAEALDVSKIVVNGTGEFFRLRL